MGNRRIAVIVAVALLASACGGKSHKATPKKKTPRTAPTTTPARVVRKAPLTGLPDPSGASFKRPAVTVKINNLRGKAQSGVGQADVVFEEVVETGITRLAAIFNSHAPDRVGPVRSVRKTDHLIAWPIGGIFAYSGGAAYAVDSISTAPVTRLDESAAGPLMFRDDSNGGAPYNLWAHVDQMFKVKDAKPVPPPPLFKYRAPGAKVSGVPALAMTVGFTGGYAATFAWDKKTGTWLRSRFDAPDVEADGARLAPKNVVVMFVQYTGGNSEGLQAEAQLTGTGDAWVFTAGKLIKGHWTRPDLGKPAELTNATGAEIRLTPGQTWVELPDVSYPVTVFP